MEMNKELLAKAYVDLKGDLENTFLGVLPDDKFLVQDQEDKNCFILQDKVYENDIYICTVEEFNNYDPSDITSETGYLLRTESNSKHLAEAIKQLETVQESKSPCQTKVNLREAKGTISAMETFMEEVGVLEAWNDNKDLYLEGK